MDELGQILRDAREARGLTLAEVQDQTRINRRFLDALESGEYATLPTPIHVRGFLRNYARFLRLDPEPLLARYEAIRPLVPAHQATNGDGVTAEPPPGGEALPLREDQPFFDPVNVELAGSQRRDPESLLRLLIILALIVFLGLVANRFVPLLMGNGDGSDNITDGINQVWQDLVQGETEPAAADQPAADNPGPDATADPSQVILNTSRNDAAGAALPTPTPTRPVLPATLDVIQLRLDVTERTWMEATIDGDVRFSGYAKRGDVFEWSAEEEAKILTGNAYGLIATINDQEWGRLGGFQEANEYVWRTTQ